MDVCIELMLETVSGFDMERFRKLHGRDEMTRYLKTHSRPMGSGSARSVWDTGLGYVIKLGTPGNGQAQNEHEAKLAACAGESPIVPAVLAHSKDMTWLAVERVTPVIGRALDSAVSRMTDGVIKTRKELNHVVGIMKYFDRYVNAKEKPPEEHFVPSVVKVHSELMATNSWYKHLFALVSKGCVRPGEMHQENWGLDTSKMLVLLDPGL